MKIVGSNKNLKNSLSSRNPFQLKALEMQVIDNILNIRIKAPTLKENNYALDICKGILTLKVIIPKIYPMKEKLYTQPVFVESFLSLPKKNFDHIIDAHFLDENLIIKIGDASRVSSSAMVSLNGVA